MAAGPDEHLDRLAHVYRQVALGNPVDIDRFREYRRRIECADKSVTPVVVSVKSAVERQSV